ncbi:AraC family transcriptional regulator [Paenibacillus glycanilyticus]|uniref:AraC family transcriptional regulator n=1 Tax=Paenibacillus glycanilyticus TaxID=126569 RepID=A0ABQ6GIK9_9BACL|nr:AraC family transcriptional regulator [Paenibacillus glycanilyticus]GLX70088.1 AraC family transcriptional regulator [Paenibacillus glycanilyticus]
MMLVDIRTDSLILHHAVDREKTSEYALHCHNFYEVFYFIGGNVSYLVEGQRYVLEPNSLLLIAPHVFHGVKVESDIPYERISLHFVPGILPPENQTALLSAFHNFRSAEGIYYSNDGKIFSFLEQLIEAWHADESIRDMLLRIRLEALLSQILMMSYTHKNALQDFATAKSIAPILSFLNERMTETVTLDELSAKFFISKHHLNKIFRKATGTTVGNYLIHKRVVMAQNLIQQGHTASSAATEAGFRDYSAFYRAYKKVLGHAPSSNGALLY